MKNVRTIDEVIADNMRLLDELQKNKKRFFDKYGK